MTSRIISFQLSPVKKKRGKVFLNKRILCFLFFIFLLTASTAQTFQKTFGGINGDYAVSSQHTNAGGYIITGSSNGGDHIYLLRTDSIGNPLWTKTYGDISLRDEGFSVQQTTDGGYIITGWGGASGGGPLKVYLLKTNAGGTIVWKKTYRGTDTNAGGYVGYFVRETNDGGFIVTGKSDTFGANDDLYLIRFNSVGDTLWTKIIGGTNSEVGTCVLQTSDSDCIVYGYTSSFGAGCYDVLLVKTDSSGNPLWSKTYGGNDYDTGWSMQQTNDGGYIMSASTRSFGQGNYDVYLIKTDSTGNLLWSKTYGGTGRDVAYSVLQTSDGGFIVAGSSDSFGTDSMDVYVVKTDSAGNLEWSKIYGGPNPDQGNSVLQTNDGGYFITGWTRSFGAGNYDVYLIKTDSAGNSGCNEDNPLTITTTPSTQVTNATPFVSSGGTLTIPAPIVGSGGIENILCYVGIDETGNNEFANGILVFPNPATEQLSVISYQLSGNKTLEIYNIIGEEVLSENFSAQKHSVNVSAFPPGIYFVQVRSRSQTRTQKFIINR